MLKVVGDQETIPPAISQSCNLMRKAAENIDRKKDIADFISTTTTGSAKPAEAKYEPYGGSSSDSPSVARQGSRMSIATSSSSFTRTQTSSPLVDSSTSAPKDTHSSASSAATTSTTTAAASAPSAPASTGATSAQKGNVRAIYDYTATEDNELTFKANDRIVVLQKDDSGWWQGELNGQVGMFPSNFVEQLNGQKNTGTTAAGSTAAAAAEPPTKEAGGQCKVLYDYNADSDSELTVKQGDILTVESEDEGWLFGFNAKGDSGRFPSNYVQMLHL